MGSTMYYLTLAVAALAIGIYNFNIGGSGKNIQCCSITQMTEIEYKSYNDSLTLGGAVATTNLCLSIVANQTDSANLFNVKQPSSNIFALLQFIIAILYIIIFGFALYMAFIISFMGNQVPEDFIKISTCKRVLACFCKIVPPLLILVHWLILILILVIWIMVITGNCKDSTSSQPGLVAGQNRYFNDTYMLNIISTSMWILIHYVGAIIKEITYTEPFMYSPDIGKPSCKSIFLKKLGP